MIDMPETILRKVLQSSRLRIEVEMCRFALYLGLLALMSILANYVSIPGVPLLYIELILLAPFLRYSWANILMWVSILTAVIRFVQGLYGFDQLFISAYLFFANVEGFPVGVVWLCVIAVLLIFGIIFFSNYVLPKFFISTNVFFFFIILLGCVGIKKQEDTSKLNLIGTSFGYLFGQLRFSEMFYGPYEIPMLSTDPYPTEKGAAYAIEHRLNLVLIMVESMGMPSHDEARRFMLSVFDTPNVLNKYDVQEGMVFARGSTIHGEIRELCRGRLGYGLFGESADGCVARIMSQAGYQTTAIHANFAKMYGRDEWYPRVGFDDYINTNTGQLPYEHIEERWGSALDTSLIDWLDSQGDRQKKSFKYVLTVSTHLPAILLPGATISDICLQDMPENARTHLANLKLVIDKIGAYAARQKNTIFVIVGDHPPSFVSPASRAAFKEFEVPYVILQPKKFIN